MTQAQLVQMGAAIQPVAQLPQMNGVFNLAYCQIDAQVSYPISLKRLREGVTLEPVIAFYNAGNFSNFKQHQRPAEHDSCRCYQQRHSRLR